MIKLTVLLSAVATLACNPFKRDNDHAPTASPPEELTELADGYCVLEDAGADAFGFVGVDCDLVLFNALRSIGCPTSIVDLIEAEEPTKPGQWNRDPARACYVDGRTSAKFSRDMLVGVLLWAWRTGPTALPVVERLLDYVDANDGYVCEAVNDGVREARCKLRGNMLGTMAELRYRLGGVDDERRGNKQFFDPTVGGSDRHVQALHLYLRALMFGGVSDVDLAVLEQYAKANPLLAAMARKFQSGELEDLTAAVLDDVDRFPRDRLPDTLGRCTDYLWQRDRGADWEPCAAGEAPASYTGIDLVFFRAIVADLLPVGESTSLVDDGRPHRYKRNEALNVEPESF